MKAFNWRRFVLAYDGEGEGEGEGEGGEGEGDGKEIEGKEIEGEKKVGKSFSQDEVNRLLAEERRKTGRNRDQLIDQLKSLRESTKLSDEQKEELQTRIEQLQNETLTTQEMAKREREKLTKEHQKNADKLVNERDFWRNAYSIEKISRELIDAGVEHGAVNPQQLARMMRPDTRLVEEIDKATGNPTGHWVPKVTLREKDENGNTITLELAPSDAIKRMSEMSENWNLFNVGVKSGLNAYSRTNGSPLRGSKPPADLEQYKKWREANLSGS